MYLFLNIHEPETKRIPLTNPDIQCQIQVPSMVIVPNSVLEVPFAQDPCLGLIGSRCHRDRERLKEFVPIKEIALHGGGTG